jgi:hypothetical protein
MLLIKQNWVIEGPFPRLELASAIVASARLLFRASACYHQPMRVSCTSHLLAADGGLTGIDLTVADRIGGLGFCIKTQGCPRRSVIIGSLMGAREFRGLSYWVPVISQPGQATLKAGCVKS